MNGAGKSCTGLFCTLSEDTSWVKKSGSSFSISPLALMGFVWAAPDWESRGVALQFFKDSFFESHALSDIG